MNNEYNYIHHKYALAGMEELQNSSGVSSDESQAEPTIQTGHGYSFGSPFSLQGDLLSETSICSPASICLNCQWDAKFHHRYTEIKL